MLVHLRGKRRVIKDNVKEKTEGGACCVEMCGDVLRCVCVKVYMCVKC